MCYEGWHCTSSSVFAVCFPSSLAPRFLTRRGEHRRYFYKSQPTGCSKHVFHHRTAVISRLLLMVYISCLATILTTAREEGGGRAFVDVETLDSWYGVCVYICTCVQLFAVSWVLRGQRQDGSSLKLAYVASLSKPACFFWLSCETCTSKHCLSRESARSF